MNPTEPIPGETSAESEASRSKINWLIFWIVMFTPAAVSLIALAFYAQGFAVVSTFFGSGIAGIWCGIKLARQIGRTVGRQVLLAIVFAVGLALLSFGLCFVGCLPFADRIRID